MHKLTGICLNESYFLYENKIGLLENTGPIGLSLMVVLSESYLRHLEHKAMAEALNIQIQPKTIIRCTDDSHAQIKASHRSITLMLPSKHQANTFQKI